MLIVVRLLLTYPTVAQTQVTITLITDPGVKHSDNLRFYITNGHSTTHNFTFKKFSKTGNYSNLTLFQYSEDIDQGHFKFHVTLKTATEKNVVDSLTIANTTIRVEIFVHVGVKNSTGDYIREIKTLKYESHSEPLKFTFIETPKIGSKAAFKLTNSSGVLLFGYPNNAFFFGTLYKETGKDAWSQEYPLYTELKYCDTTSSPKPLAKDETTKSWVPNEKDCTEYTFKETGNYYFELLFSEKSEPDTLVQGETLLKRQKIFREIFEFSL